MRRKDREVKDFDKICEIIKSCDTLRLGLVDGNEAYIVPVNFGYEINGEKIIFYLHCAREGRKIDLIKNNAMVTFEMDTSHELVEGMKACDYSYKYKSVMGRAKAIFASTSDEKSYGLNKLMEHHTGKCSFDFPEIMLNDVSVIKIEVVSITAKEHNN